MVGPYAVYRRPHLAEFLAACSACFRLAVWSTASDDYVRAVVGRMVPQGIDLAFAWGRSRCVRRFDPESFEEYHLKDLKKVKRLGYRLERVLIADDTPRKVRRHYGNAVYVPPFLGDPEDGTLPRLARYLMSLRDVANVGPRRSGAGRETCPEPPRGSPMPTLILSPRYSDDSITLRRAAIGLGWDVMRLASWRPPEDFEPEEPVLFSEPLFNTVVAEQLGLAVVEPPEAFLLRLPEAYVKRQVRLTTAAVARTLPGPVFLKPPNRKTFPAKVFASGADLPEMPDEDRVLAAEPVEWIAEFRFFVRDRRVRAWSPYRLHGALARRDNEWVVEPDLAAATSALVLNQA